MRKLSFLLGLSGSKHSKYASELCWELAEKTGAKALAQHVIDSRTAWELLRSDEPGFIGSGPYVQAYESLSASLSLLAEKLMEKYQALTSNRKIDSQCVIDEGNPVREICRRALDHDLVIVGHQPTGVQTVEHDRCHYVRYAIAEGLAHECPRPLLIVQENGKLWKNIKTLVSIEHLNIPFIRASQKLALAVGADLEVICLTSGIHEENPQELRHDFRKANPDLAEIPLRIEVVRGSAVDDKTSLQSAVGSQIDLDCDGHTLLVIPTREIGHNRITVFGSSPDNFVRHLTLPSILLWPEEHVPQTEHEFKAKPVEAGQIS